MNAVRAVTHSVVTHWQQSRLQLRRVWALSLPSVLARNVTNLQFANAYRSSSY